MDYFMNEYSLRGQFADVESFYESLRKYTIPALKKVSESDGDVIWKKDDFWSREICPGITLLEIPEKKNERTPEKTALKIYLRRLASSEPFWSYCGDGEIEAAEYAFDEGYRDRFEKDNCFLRAVRSEGRILSFLHDNYRTDSLKLLVSADGREWTCSLDNVYSPDFWEREPEIRSWYIEEQYRVEIRANEFGYHAPHFHVSDRFDREQSWVFLLENGKMPKSAEREIDGDTRRRIDGWYQEHRAELAEAWNGLHPEKRCKI